MGSQGTQAMTQVAHSAKFPGLQQPAFTGSLRDIGDVKYAPEGGLGALAEKGSTLRDELIAKALLCSGFSARPGTS